MCGKGCPCEIDYFGDCDVPTNRIPPCEYETRAAREAAGQCVECGRGLSAAAIEQGADLCWEHSEIPPAECCRENLDTCEGCPTDHMMVKGL